MTQHARTYTATRITPDEAKRSLVVTINTATVDRYRTVILPSGMVNDNFRKNPVVLLNHGFGERLPIAKSQREWVESNRIKAEPVFMPAEVSEVADQVYRMYVGGWMKAFSVGFDAIVERRPTPDDIRAHPEWAEAMIIYEKWELLEYSAVPVPGNPEALMEAVQRGGLRLPEWFDARGLNLPHEQIPNPSTEPAIVLVPLKGTSIEEFRALLKAELHRQAKLIGQRAVKEGQEMARGRI